MTCAKPSVAWTARRHDVADREDRGRVSTMRDDVRRLVAPVDQPLAGGDVDARGDRGGDVGEVSHVRQRRRTRCARRRRQRLASATYEEERTMKAIAVGAVV